METFFCDNVYEDADDISYDDNDDVSLTTADTDSKDNSDDEDLSTMHCMDTADSKSDIW
jgi:hypothetical protein